MSGGDFSDKLKLLIEEFERSSLRVVHIRRGSVEIHLSRDAEAAPSRTLTARPSPARAVAAKPMVGAPNSAAASAEVANAEIPPGTALVRAPNIGTFYRSPKPGTPPFVEIGQAIAIGDELCLVEVMKLFTAVRSDVAGTIAAILVEDGAMVEAGQPLFAVEAG